MIHFWDTAFIPILFAAVWGFMAILAYFARRDYEIGSAWRRRTLCAFLVYLLATVFIIAMLIMDFVSIGRRPWGWPMDTLDAVVSNCQRFSTLAAVVITVWHVFLRMRDKQRHSMDE